MYRAFFGLTATPFSIVPDPRFLFLSDRHREALVHLFYGLRDGGGFVLLTGEVGTGKTTVSRAMLEKVDSQYQLATILNPMLDARELLAAICDELGLAVSASTTNSPQANLKQLSDTLHQHLLHNHAQGRKTILLIDEAQHLQAPVLEQLRLLTNLETNQTKLLQVILIGQPELLQRLQQPALRQLLQRITARYHLLPLSLPELTDYIGFRLKTAGCERKLFSLASLRVLHKASGGIPRVINLLADRCLMLAYAQGAEQVQVSDVLNADKEIRGALPTHSPASRAIASYWATWRWPLLGYGVGALLTYACYLAVVYLGQPAWLAEKIPMFVPLVEEKQGDVVSAEKALAKRSIAETLSSDTSNVAGTNENKNNLPSATAIPKLALANASRETTGGMDNSQTPTALAEPMQKEEQPDEQVKRAMMLAREPNSAMEALYRVWGYQLQDAPADCAAADILALRCYNGTTTLARLESLNHPAMLLLRENNQAYYAVLYALEPQEAELLVGDKRWRVSRSWLEQHWLGEFTLLWQPQAAGTFKTIRQGDSGESVQWLDDQLALILKIPQRKITRFDRSLADKIGQFQARFGLNVDGSANPMTLIALNAALGSAGPTLTAKEVE
ncbi:ExeA family protein [Plesiomonas sp.]|uniref:ExeA family protein n=1 Tax=Plesiomonas sp. TaxID=2486279 RepID=UPI003F31D042